LHLPRLDPQRAASTSQDLREATVFLAPLKNTGIGVGLGHLRAQLAAAPWRNSPGGTREARRYRCVAARLSAGAVSDRAFSRCRRHGTRRHSFRINIPCRLPTRTKNSSIKMSGDTIKAIVGRCDSRNRRRNCGAGLLQTSGISRSQHRSLGQMRRSSIRLGRQKGRLPLRATPGGRIPNPLRNRVARIQRGKLRNCKFFWMKTTRGPKRNQRQRAAFGHPACLVPHGQGRWRGDDQAD